MVSRRHAFVPRQRCWLLGAAAAVCCLRVFSPCSIERGPAQREDRSQSSSQSFIGPRGRVVRIARWATDELQTGAEIEKTEKGLQKYMTPEEVAEELIKRREAEMQDYQSQNGNDRAPGDRGFFDPEWDWLAFGGGILFLALAVLYLVTVFRENNVGREGFVSYSDYCGTDAFQLKKAFFPSAECVDFMDGANERIGIEELPESDKRLPKTAEQIMAEQGLL
eukprot:TRINITY_DN27623_c0_g2_i1.p1 TRINITY_DN27623_c0_g2~~TRINITY_DN27623_c0_g2_i1.p1  ORF type:complete len:238 (-),score=38.07 TRINITY_DN27623_c0_g2_i1:109-774(-)